MGHEVLLQGVELAAAHGAVVVPPDAVFGGFITHHEFVIGAAPGMGTRRHRKRAASRDNAFAARHRLLVEHGGWRIPGNAVHPAQADA